MSQEANLQMPQDVGVVTGNGNEQPDVVTRLEVLLAQIKEPAGDKELDEAFALRRWLGTVVKLLS